MIHVATKLRDMPPRDSACCLRQAKPSQVRDGTGNGCWPLFVALPVASCLLPVAVSVFWVWDGDGDADWAAVSVWVWVWVSFWGTAAWYNSHQITSLSPCLSRSLSLPFGTLQNWFRFLDAAVWRCAGARAVFICLCFWVSLFAASPATRCVASQNNL